jgi:hypothetical protein
MRELINLRHAQSIAPLLTWPSSSKIVYAVAEWRAFCRTVGYEDDYWTLRRPLAA